MRGGELTQQLLAYARRQNLSPRPVDVNDVIGGMGELLQRSLGGLVQVETDLAPDLWPATSDPTQLELVVLNLAINARDAMPNGGRLTIATANVQRVEAGGPDGLDAGRLRADRGDRYRRRHDPRGARARLRAVLHHQGRSARAAGWGWHRSMGWRRSSAAPRGSPAAPQQAPRSRSSCRGRPWPRPPALPASRTPSRRLSGGGTVLVVDDDPDVREIAAIFLREAGYAVKEAGSGPEGHDVLAAGPVCLALVDYAMPMMSGPEFVRLARSIHPETAGDLRDRRRRRAGPRQDPAERPHRHEALYPCQAAQGGARTGARACNGSLNHSGRRPCRSGRSAVAPTSPSAKRSRSRAPGDTAAAAVSAWPADPRPARSLASARPAGKPIRASPRLRPAAPWPPAPTRAGPHPTAARGYGRRGCGFRRRHAAGRRPASGRTGRARHADASRSSAAR